MRRRRQDQYVVVVGSSSARMRLHARCGPLSRKPRPLTKKAKVGVEVRCADDGVPELARPETRPVRRTPGARAPSRTMLPGALS